MKLLQIPHYLLGSLLLFTACHSDRPVVMVAERFIQYYQQNFSTELPEVAALAGLTGRLDSLSAYRSALATVDTYTLSGKGKLQKQLLQKQLEEEWDHWAPYQNNPALYNLGGLLKKQLVQSEQDLQSRLQQLSALMDEADVYYTHARTNLRVGEDPSLYRLAAQKQYLGLEFLKGELTDSLHRWQLLPEKKRWIEQKIPATYRALKDYLAFCESVYLNHRDSTHYAVTR